MIENPLLSPKKREEDRFAGSLSHKGKLLQISGAPESAFTSQVRQNRQTERDSVDLISGVSQSALWASGETKV